MEAEEKPKGYFVFKKINTPAKIIGLYYNTFFVFVLAGAIIIMGFSSKFSILGVLYGLGVTLIVYFALFFYQTKFGPKKIAKIINNYMEPIHYIKIKKSIKKMYKK